MKSIKRVGTLSFPMTTQDPFLFAVYHKDNYPAGDDKMQAPRTGNGADFDMDADYRMYHGDRIPGFPQHPHRGFETVTCTLMGLTDHTDSLGCSGRYGNGDLQWMTAGKGIVHGENFPLLNQDKPNPLRLFQIWLNLPKKSKMVKPTQRMFWHENIPNILQEDGSRIRVWAGNFNGTQGLQPPPDSWAADSANNVGIFYMEIPKDGSVVLKGTSKGTNRSLYFIQGTPKINSEALEPNSFVEVVEDAELKIENPSKTPLEVLVLQGNPIKEPIAQGGPFVMNTQQEILQARVDYQKTRFGGWPWNEDAVIFPRDVGRFVKVGGKKEVPPSK